MPANIDTYIAVRIEANREAGCLNYQVVTTLSSTVAKILSPSVDGANLRPIMLGDRVITVLWLAFPAVQRPRHKPGMSGPAPAVLA